MLKKASMKRRASQKQRLSATERSLRTLLKRLATTCGDPAHLVELYYWSAEPELIQALRRYITLPDASRNALLAFLAMTADCPETVEVTVSHEGDVTLYSRAVREVMLKTASLRANDGQAEIIH